MIGAASVIPSRKDPVRSRIVPLALALVGSLALASCAGAAPGKPASTEAGDGHGEIAGAVELAEPALGLTSVDADGAVRHLDLLDESVTDLGSTAPPVGMTTDGRYLFVETADGVQIVDSGVWTWDHVDHFHYYRAEPRLLGTVEGEGPVTVATTNSSTTGGTGLFFAGSGESVLLDTEALSKGEVVERFRDDDGGLVVPVGSFALVARGGEVAVRSADGAPTGESAACVDPRGAITTRVGAVVGCGDGALLATAATGGVAIERIPYPQGTTAPRAEAFANREGRPTVAALAGDSAVWLLDTRAREWTLLPAPAPLAAVTAVDDADGHVLALAKDGRMLVLEAATGAQLAATEPLVADSLSTGAAPVLIADQQRAYLSAPSEHRMFEIDFADGARLARTFETASAPAFVAETGR
ncbi:ABC transporter [Microbacterium sp. Gd 4-13]|uniref:ABC transporter n=1 Tax=Microbacterium sp. Gd 4-13 TaxID=2173179 RepID=UPI001F0CA770|nr:ABC transporter [Microbacterium sp. Gd 4-13]